MHLRADSSPVHLIHITMKQREERKERAFIHRHGALIFLARRELAKSFRLRTRFRPGGFIKSRKGVRPRDKPLGSSTVVAREEIRRKSRENREARAPRISPWKRGATRSRARINKTVGRRIVAYLAMKHRPSVAPSCGTCTVSRLHPREKHPHGWVMEHPLTPDARKKFRLSAALTSRLRSRSGLPRLLEILRERRAETRGVSFSDDNRGDKDDTLAVSYASTVRYARSRDVLIARECEGRSNLPLCALCRFRP
jgi:hypothetical protein